jgi:hypothetical protein
VSIAAFLERWWRCAGVAHTLCAPLCNANNPQCPCTLQFEPFCLLWETAETWMTLKSQWLHDPFLSLNPVTIERDHDLCTKSINKSVRNFERMGLPACQDIAVQIKKEVRVLARNRGCDLFNVVCVAPSVRCVWTSGEVLFLRLHAVSSASLVALPESLQMKRTCVDCVCAWVLGRLTPSAPTSLLYWVCGTLACGTDTGQTCPQRSASCSSPTHPSPSPMCATTHTHVSLPISLAHCLDSVMRCVSTASGGPLSIVSGCGVVVCMCAVMFGSSVSLRGRCWSWTCLFTWRPSSE